MAVQVYKAEAPHPLGAQYGAQGDQHAVCFFHGFVVQYGGHAFEGRKLFGNSPDEALGVALMYFLQPGDYTLVKIAGSFVGVVVHKKKTTP